MDLPETFEQPIYFEDIVRRAHLPQCRILFTNDVFEPESHNSEKISTYIFNRKEKDNLHMRYRNDRKFNFCYTDQTEQRYSLNIVPENNDLVHCVGQIYDSIETKTRLIINAAIIRLGEKIQYEIDNGVYK